MDAVTALTCLAIVLARITDVTLGTLRTVCIVRGRRGVAWVLVFFEALTWVMVITQVVQNLDNPWYAAAFAVGFATGSPVGITIERRLAYGQQVVRIFTRKAAGVVELLRQDGLRVTRFPGEGRNGSIDMLFIQVQRRQVPSVLARAHERDPECYTIVDDVCYAGGSTAPLTPGTVVPPTGWRGLLKRK